MKMVDEGKIQPVIYREKYIGLESVSRALEDAQKHIAWGRAIVRINQDAELELQRQVAKL